MSSSSSSRGSRSSSSSSGSRGSRGSRGSNSGGGPNSNSYSAQAADTPYTRRKPYPHHDKTRDQWIKGGALADVNNPLYHAPRFAQVSKVSPSLLQLRGQIENAATANQVDDQEADANNDQTDQTVQEDAAVAPVPEPTELHDDPTFIPDEPGREYDDPIAKMKAIGYTDEQMRVPGAPATDSQQGEITNQAVEIDGNLSPPSDPMGSEMRFAQVKAKTEQKVEQKTQQPLNTAAALDNIIRDRSRHVSPVSYLSPAEERHLYGPSRTPGGFYPAPYPNLYPTHAATAYQLWPKTAWAGPHPYTGIAAGVPPFGGVTFPSVVPVPVPAVIPGVVPMAIDPLTPTWGD